MKLPISLNGKGCTHPTGSGRTAVGHKQLWSLVLSTVVTVLATRANGESTFSREPAHVLSASATDPWRIVGVGSCAAAGCHGAGRTDRVVGSEYNIWITQDPHARAYSTLYSERSQRMVRLLDGLAPQEEVAPHTDNRCLACHSMTDAPPLDKRRNVLTDGVGCEACHGPAERWRAEHFRRPLSPSEREQFGLWDTDSLLVRTQTCVRCHVGAPGREVNHDLIAAGHPRLQFEMGAYLDAMPKHWDEAKDRARHGPDFDALVWALGQACASQAALEQLAERADPSHAKTWPEFAEWSCSACHHHLRDDLDRQRRLAEGERLAGQRIAWDTWNHFTAFGHAVDVSRAFELNTDAASRIESNVQELARQMERLNPNRRRVADLARGTAIELERWSRAIESPRIRRSRIDVLTRAILESQLDAGAYEWARAAQAYNALASLHETRLRTEPSSQADLTAALHRMHEDLARKQLAPQGYVFRPDQTRRQLIEVKRLLPREGDR